MNTIIEESQCPNYELCGNTVPVPGIGNGFCMTCGSWFKYGGFGWNQLTFINSSEICSVCFNDCERKLMFPAGCGHSFCIDCSKQILFWNSSRYCKSPVSYGCPPCPNGCNNPITGYQCDCIEYDPVIDQWQQNDPVNWNRWNNEQTISIETCDNNPVYGKCICPLCRAKYVRMADKHESI